MKTAFLLMVVCVGMAMAGQFIPADHNAPACLCSAPDVPVCDVNGFLYNPDCIQGCYHDDIDDTVMVYDPVSEKCVDA